MNLDDKLKLVIETARMLDASCLKYTTIYDQLFAPGLGIAWKMFQTTDERTAFIASRQFKEVHEILARAQNDKMR